MFNRVTVNIITIFLLFIIINEVQCFHKRKHKHKSSINEDKTVIDLFIMSQEWPPAACIAVNKQRPPTDYVSSSCKLPKSKNWTMHGLWVEGAGNKHVVDCARNKFKSSLLEPELKEKMNIIWPTYHLRKKNKDFWAHEFQKHGSCAFLHPDIKTESDYFSKSLELFEKYNMAKALQTANIQPGENKYELKNVQKGLQDHFKVDVQLGCYTPKNNSVQYLNEIRLCFDTSFRLTDCKRGAGNCSKKRKITYLNYS